MTNGDRVTSLYKAFTVAGIPVDRQIFDDYLAIKYLRNTIIHGRWKAHERDWLNARGFPGDTRELTKAHMDKIERVNQNMMFYVALTGTADPNSAKPAKLAKLDETVALRKDDTGILRIRDIERIIWNNLERIDAHIYKDIERAAISEQYTWTAGLSQAQPVALDQEDQKRMFYLAARRAGEENYEPLAQHRPLAKEALEFWREYWQRAVPPSLDEARIDQAVELLENSDFIRAVGGATWLSFIHEMPDAAARSVVDSALGKSCEFTGEQVVNAFKSGRRMYDAVRNITPVSLFVVRLPIVDPANTPAYLREAARALRAFRLNRAWFSWVENHRPPDKDLLAFYERMAEELARRPSAR